MPIPAPTPFEAMEFPEIRFPELAELKMSTAAPSGDRIPFPTITFPPGPPLVAAPTIVPVLESMLMPPALLPTEAPSAPISLDCTIVPDARVIEIPTPNPPMKEFPRMTVLVA